MPNQNGQGPTWGNGPRTGRGLGPCGKGQAFGRGFGRRNWQRFEPVNLTKEEQKKILEAEKKEIEKELKELK